jgi:hypothetical protein
MQPLFKYGKNMDKIGVRTPYSSEITEQAGVGLWVSSPVHAGFDGG